MEPNSYSPAYREQPIEEYRGNPLIEALPEILSEKQAALKMLFKPPFDTGERQLPTELRWHLLGRLKHIVVPRRPTFYEVERTISRLIRTGYVVRNPAEPATWRTIYTARNGAATFVDPRLVLTESQAFIVGLSGSGKTTCADAVLRTYPQQVIRHSFWNGRHMPITQLVWLKVTCPKNGSISSFCREFARQVDIALNTGGTYEKDFSKSKMREDMLEGSMRQIAASHFLGLLFIDEIQRLSLAKTGGAIPLLRFLQDLRTLLRVPVVEIGTSKAAALFSYEMKDARRASENGPIYFRRPPKRNKEWDDFVRRVWAYQWVRNATPPDDNMLDTVFDLSQSIPDFVVLLFKLAQQQAMVDESETITIPLLKQIYDEYFTLLHSALNKLREGTVESLSIYEDLLPPEDVIARLTVNRREVEIIQDHLDELDPLPEGYTTDNSPSPAADPAQHPDVVDHESAHVPSTDEFNDGDLRNAGNSSSTAEALRNQGSIDADPLGLHSSAGR
ncbi:ATP-binding protein [Noviherbaspirillum sp. UKPF54]|uniref:ATP-binding protein n=1 Tax=Noviherbaspirillum sp. UKPF54 TaxID=2601898 RepID=UPI0011B1080C|nr:ATP-binding protein [Noviherbaspirillum sp. UKPF54]QDZ30105.1 ATP-binding protein [Noviherbaspirillum sp. UKPF54]